MKTLLKILRDFLHECGRPTAVEYAVLLVLIIFGAMTSISLLGASLGNTISSAAAALPSGASGEASSESSQGEETQKRGKRGRRGKRAKRQNLCHTCHLI